ncbi:MAG TPA: FtsH protease activity modulator HflK [Burkholderiaceae bacterium]|nr:FtsH protease activity modulator HflK [Burkholderiaceae bacterium]
MRTTSKVYNLNDPGWGRDKGNSSDRPRRPDQGSGPPDLDEVWRDFNNRLGGLFGRRGGGGGRGRPGGAGPSLPKGSPRLFGLVALVVIALWLASGFIIVPEGQVAVVTRFGQYTKTLAPGLQWRWPYPIEDHHTVNIAQLRTFEVGFRGSSRNKVLGESLMLTTDENIIDLQFVVQYRLLPEGAPDYLFKTSHPDESVRQAAETAMREVVGQQPMDSVLYSGRTEIAAQVQRQAQEILDRYQTGIQISTVAIQNVQPPEEVQAAFDDAVKAGQDRERLINEGNAYASKILPETQGQVARMLQDAEGYKARVVGAAKGEGARFNSIEREYTKAPDVTRERMYLSTMQEILENTGKVVVDTEEGNNLLYLPLDKISGGSGSSANVDRPALTDLIAAGGASSNKAASDDASSANKNTETRSRSRSTSNPAFGNPYAR